MADPITWPVTTDVGPGLSGVIATETRFVPLDGPAASTDLEETSFLLLTGLSADADAAAYGAYRRKLRASRVLPDAVVSLVGDLPPETHPTRLLRAGISALGCHELSVTDDLAGERHWRELRLVGQVAGLVGAVVRHRRGQPLVDPPPEESLAASLLAALLDRPPSPEAVSALDLLWVLYATHGLDAPTFTSMVVASCRADPYANVVAGLSALRGPREGGAGERVLAQVLPLADPAEARAWVGATLSAGGLIAGFGHGGSRTPDPRVPVLRAATVAFARRAGREDLIATWRALEEAAGPALAAKGVHVNVNFHGALLLYLLGADGPLVPCLLAVARMAGLVARVSASLDDIRLYRPLSRYVGAPPRALPEGRSA